MISSGVQSDPISQAAYKGLIEVMRPYSFFPSWRKKRAAEKALKELAPLIDRSPREDLKLACTFLQDTLGSMRRYERGYEQSVNKIGLYREFFSHLAFGSASGSSYLASLALSLFQEVKREINYQAFWNYDNNLKRNFEDQYRQILNYGKSHSSGFEKEWVALLGKTRGYPSVASSGRRQGSVRGGHPPPSSVGVQPASLFEEPALTFLAALPTVKRDGVVQHLKQIEGWLSDRDLLPFQEESLGILSSMAREENNRDLVSLLTFQKGLKPDETGDRLQVNEWALDLAGSPYTHTSRNLLKEGASLLSSLKDSRSLLGVGFQLLQEINSLSRKEDPSLSPLSRKFLTAFRGPLSRRDPPAAGEAAVEAAISAAPRSLPSLAFLGLLTASSTLFVNDAQKKGAINAVLQEMGEVAGGSGDACTAGLLQLFSGLEPCFSGNDQRTLAAAAFFSSFSKRYARHPSSLDLKGMAAAGGEIARALRSSGLQIAEKVHERLIGYAVASAGGQKREAVMPFVGSLTRIPRALSADPLFAADSERRFFLLSTGLSALAEAEDPRHALLLWGERLFRDDPTNPFTGGSEMGQWARNSHRLREVNPELYSSRKNSCAAQLVRPFVREILQIQQDCFQEEEIQLYCESLNQIARNSALDSSTLVNLAHATLSFLQEISSDSSPQTAPSSPQTAPPSFPQPTPSSQNPSAVSPSSSSSSPSQSSSASSSQRSSTTSAKGVTSTFSSQRRFEQMIRGLIALTSVPSTSLEKWLIRFSSG